MSKQQRPTRDEYNREKKQRTRADVLAAAVRLAKKYGLASVKRDDVAREAECAAGTVNFHFQTMAFLQNEIIREAIRTRSLKLIAEGIVGGYTAARGVNEPLRSEALASFSR